MSSAVFVRVYASYARCCEHVGVSCADHSFFVALWPIPLNSRLAVCKRDKPFMEKYFSEDPHSRDGKLYICCLVTSSKPLRNQSLFRYHQIATKV